MSTFYTFTGGPVRLVTGEQSNSDAVFATAKAMLEKLNRRSPPRSAKPMAKPASAAASQPAAFAAGYLIADAKRRAQAWEMSRKAPDLGDAA
jgi:hypothetical protein